MTRDLRWPAFVLLAATAFALPFIGDSYIVQLATRMLIFGMAALGIDFFLAYVGQLSLGHTIFLASGAYLTALLTMAGLESALLVWPIVLLGVALLALAAGMLALRTGGLYFIMITLAFTQMLFFFLQSQRGLGGDEGFSVPQRNTLPLLDLSDPRNLYLLVLVLLLGVIGLIAWIRATPFGAAIEACRDNAQRLSAMGLDPYGYRLSGFVFSAVIVGLAGILYTNNTLYLTPALSGWYLSGELLMMVILGGSGSLLGPVLGAALFVLLQEQLSHITPHWMAGLGALLVARVMLMKDGFWNVLARRLGGDDSHS
ncbi:branched-chain amino acid ABC transporter permease [Chelatococcus asaccharovorans]|uniref:Amino acid/amide ABC transporter membrane protein 2 (HAAT family) n=1 Tax=Chelatococcus asaccharovorans TaxID=28210 RepID=A0A2V3U0A4_9HYPH|nr:branched-chain amino acid ABC transporter permease [Chelatococcus asaccharovorans]MBS7707759.1 branched-chain amino acid ABC transporter permease [Chelatococcus asaccharovorans]PXW55336.1 amino acid/amide ABC transporter membrane protein 2 (HAAT family) [Chelatococcus asaccharovorans]